MMGFDGIYCGIHLEFTWYPLAMANIANWKMAIEIVSFPTKHGEFP